MHCADPRKPFAVAALAALSIHLGGCAVETSPEAPFREIKLPQRDLAEVVQKAEEGWEDLDFTLASLRREKDGRLRGVARGLHKGRTVGFGFVLSESWNRKPVTDSGGAFYWGRVELISMGAESHELIQVLDEVYKTKLGCRRMRSTTVFAAVSLKGNPAQFEHEPIKMKLFFESDDEGRYAEFYLNADSQKATVQFHEKDPGYRAPVVLALCEPEARGR